MSDKPKRRWYIFSIRDLFWVTVVVALAVAWFVEQRRSADLSVEQRRLTAELSKEREFRSSLREIRGSMESHWYKRVWGESPNSSLPQPMTGVGHRAGAGMILAPDPNPPMP
ncbi:MAG: hypothetical protein ACR2FY_26620 [Pirellulaceae bacterium]